MDVATLLLLTSSVGVGFGWQPMPDGSPRVEYLVQIEPEMLTALEAGSVIPIVSEVPQEIGPIGRVRIVIGRETLPRQGLPEPIQAIRHKPNSDPPSSNVAVAPATSVQQDSMVLRGQFTPSAIAGSTTKTSSPSMPSQNAPPPGFTVNSTADNLYQQAIESGERQAEAAQASVTKSATEMSNGLQTQLNEQRQQAADWLRQGLPTQSAPEGLNPASGAASGRPVAKTQVPNEYSIVRGSPPVTNSHTPGPQVFDSRVTAGAQGAAGATGGMNSNLYPSIGGETTGLQRLDRPMPVGATSGERQPVAGQNTGSLGIGKGVPRELSGQAVAPGFPQSYPAPPRLKFPAPETSATNSPNREQNSQGVGKFQRASAAPSGQPVASPTQTGPSHTEQASTGPSPATGAPMGSSQVGLANKTETKGDSKSEQLGHSEQEQSGQLKPLAGGQAGSGFMLLLAWVLLVGSVAGNLYLFWSYLDIRGKYHAMIRSNRGSHHSYSSAA